MAKKKTDPALVLLERELEQAMNNATYLAKQHGAESGKAREAREKVKTWQSALTDYREGKGLNAFTSLTRLHEERKAAIADAKTRIRQPSVSKEDKHSYKLQVAEWDTNEKLLAKALAHIRSTMNCS